MPRLHLTRVVSAFSFGAICMYVVLLTYSYESITGAGNRHGKAIAFHDGVLTNDNPEGYVDRIPRRRGRVRSDRFPNPKKDLDDKVMKMKKQVASHQVRLGHAGDVDKHAAPKIFVSKVRSSSKAEYNKFITVPKSKHYVDEPIDVHDYKYIHRPQVCYDKVGRNIKVLLIFIVTTAPNNFARRSLIRQTYGDDDNWPILDSGAIMTVFMLGGVSDVSLQFKINTESRKYGDILQENFVDSYANLTLKTVMGLKWVANHCRHAAFTMKIDDDSMIHQNRLLRMLSNASRTNFTAAEAMIGAPVLRNTSSKYYISNEYFPDPTYPPYLNGPGYIVSTDLALGLYRVATTTPLFPWEDVFLGLCLKQLGVTPIEYHDFMLIIAEESQVANKKEAIALFRYFTLVSNLEPEHMKIMWDATNHSRKKLNHKHL